MWPTTDQLKNKDLKKMRITRIESNNNGTHYLMGIKLINAAGQSSQQFGNFNSGAGGGTCQSNSITLKDKDIKKITVYYDSAYPRGLTFTYKDGSTDNIVGTGGDKYDVNFEEGEILIGASFDTANCGGHGCLGKMGFTLAKKI